MRKRIVIGLFGLVASAVLVFVLTQPRKGTVEYHLRAYRAELDRCYGRESLVKRSVDTVRGWVGLYPTDVTDQGVVAQEDALIKLGYLERREFTVTNLAAGHAVATLGQKAMTAIPGLCRIRCGPRPGVVVIVARREDMPKWRKLVGEAEAAARTNKQSIMR